MVSLVVLSHWQEHQRGFETCRLHRLETSPGRFFAATNLKLLLANIVLYYDIEPIPSRPKNNYLAMMVGPPMEATLRVRRRKE